MVTRSIRYWLVVFVAAVSLSTVRGEDASSRLATYEMPSGERFFALAVQPPEDAGLRKAVSSAERSVVILIDTSASQTGEARAKGVQTLETMLATLPASAQVSVVAVDIKATSLSEGFVSPQGSAATQALQKLRRRLPLGHTDLAMGLNTAVNQLESRNGSKALVYIGDGSVLGSMQESTVRSNLIDKARKHQISCHSLLIGPTTTMAALAPLANHTGGVVLMAGEVAAPTLGANLASLATHDALWPISAQVPESLKQTVPSELPPLRLDRDSVLLGRLAAAGGSGEVSFQVKAGDRTFKLAWQVKAEPSNPDFGFLPSLVEQAEADGGLDLPTFSSGTLRDARVMIQHQAEELLKAGSMAMSRGQTRGAQAIAQLAMKLDPGSVQARELAKAAGQSLTNQVPPVGDAVPAEPIDPLLNELPSDLLDQVQQERLQQAGRLRASVRASIQNARRRLASDPTGIDAELKVMLDMVNASTEVPASTRQELADQLRSLISEVQRREIAYLEQQAMNEKRAATAVANQRLVEDTARRENHIQQLTDNVNALIKAGLPEQAAGEVVPEIKEIVRTSPASRHEDIAAEQTDAFTEKYSHLNQWYRYRRLRAENFLNALALAEKALIPFVDEPPIYYPDPEVWKRLSIRRIDRYGSIELSGVNNSERRIYSALDDETSVQFDQERLEDVINTLSTRHNIPIHLDKQALDDLGLTPDEPITANFPNITLRSAFRLLLKDKDLTYMIKDEVLQITSVDRASENVVTRVYPVGDLVVPVISMGGGMGGGMMGGGMMGGGMGGGMGGMGGGMGGMGGGMGGMGGGMGGGMFAVPDQVSLSEKNSAIAAADQIIKLEIATDQSVEDAWDAYFERLELTTPAEQSLHNARVRSTVMYYSIKAKQADESGKHDEALEMVRQMRSIVQSCLRLNQPQLWMYQTLALALEAENGDREEIERALLSAVDVADSPDELLLVAAQMERLGFASRAFEIYRDAIRFDPLLIKAYVESLRLAAKEIDDIEKIRWSCVEVLRQSWKADEVAVQEQATLLARATERRLFEQGRVVEAQQFHQDIVAASARDCVVTLTWTGDADIDLSVQEPSGTICNLQNQRTASGGVLFNDGVSRSDSGNVRGTTETYLCSHGFSGVYDILIRRVHGNVATGNVTVDIVTDLGRPQQRHIRQQLPLTEKDALIQVNVQDGRRKTPMALAQVKDVEAQAKALGQNVLAQAASPNPLDLSAAAALARDIRRYGGASRAFFGPNAGAVGFQPNITVIPEGTSLSALAIISADRRYVRITPSPFFSAIAEVNTFNFVTGEGTTQGGGGGAGGLGGIGGGVGGGAGGGFCWVAREVYGEENPKWLVFRSWLQSDAPDWLYQAYGAYGERFASWLSDKPMAKSSVRWLMDQAIAGR